MLSCCFVFLMSSCLISFAVLLIQLEKLKLKKKNHTSCLCICQTLLSYSLLKKNVQTVTTKALSLHRQHNQRCWLQRVSAGADSAVPNERG